MRKGGEGGIIPLTTASNGRFLLPRIVLYKLPIIRMRALEAVVSTRTYDLGSRHFVLESAMKTCTRCKQEKQETEFRNIGIGRLASRCKECEKERYRDRKNRYYKENKERLDQYHKEWRDTNKEVRNNYSKEFRAKYPDRAKSIKLKYLYGITLDDYNSMLSTQGGVCAICGVPPDKKRLHVDHSHSKGFVRGLLCGRCNRVIGAINEEREILFKMAEYLESYEKS